MIGLELVVRVEERHERRTCDREAQVQSRGLATVRRPDVRQTPFAEQPLDQRQRTVLAAIVDDDVLEVGDILIKHRADRVGKDARPVVGGGDHRYGWPVAAGFQSPPLRCGAELANLAGEFVPDDLRSKGRAG